jgi:ribonucleoside-diphosphate reductase alpha chain
VEEIKNSYFLSWQLGLKANALYRDGSKLSQPLNVKSDDELEKKTDEEDPDSVAAAKDELAKDVALAAHAASSSLEPATRNPQLATLHSDNLVPATIQPVEKIIERIVERPLRRRLPDTRSAKTHKFDVAGHEGYITVGLYDDNAPGEVFITMAKEGSTIGGLMDTIATLISVSLQYGVPVESLVRKFEHVRFEPSGMTRNAEIPFAKSLIDYIFRWLAMEFVPGYRAANAPKRVGLRNAPPSAPVSNNPAGTTQASHSPNAPETLETLEKPAPEASLRRSGNGNGNGNGHGHGTGHKEPAAGSHASPLELHPKVDTLAGAPHMRLVVAADPLSQQTSDLQTDAPACDVCGSITVRSGTCYKCLNCGNSMGCS